MQSITVPPLAPYLAAVPDFRRARGKRHPLPALLLLCCVALLSGRCSEAAIAAWAADYGRDWLARLGFTRPYGPSQATLSRLFAGLDWAALERQLGRWAQAVEARGVPDGPRPVEAAALALDGKTPRGAARRGAADARLLSVLSQRWGVVLGQVAVADATNEIGAAPAALAGVPLRGRVVTADALLTQADLAQAILDAGGDYLMVVKENQPTVHEDLERLFDDPAAPVAVAETVEVQRGRVEERRLRASTELVGYTDWPGLRQALCLERRVTLKRTGEVRTGRLFAVTSLAPTRATPAQVLVLWREHWHIENKLHWVRDVTFGEDRSGVHAGHAPQVMAALRNAAIGLLRAAGRPDIAAATRRYAARPVEALALVGLPLQL
jgi:predicted transposase YbfD/YdcC